MSGAISPHMTPWRERGQRCLSLFVYLFISLIC